MLEKNEIYENIKYRKCCVALEILDIPAERLNLCNDFGKQF